jgi:hypothetical protein
LISTFIFYNSSIYFSIGLYSLLVILNNVKLGKAYERGGQTTINLKIKDYVKSVILFIFSFNFLNYILHLSPCTVLSFLGKRCRLSISYIERTEKLQFFGNIVLLTNDNCLINETITSFFTFGCDCLKNRKVKAFTTRKKAKHADLKKKKISKLFYFCCSVSV